MPLCVDDCQPKASLPQEAVENIRADPANTRLVRRKTRLRDSRRRGQLALAEVSQPAGARLDGDMQMPKHSDEDKARFRAMVKEAPGVEVKPMFGSLGAFVNGNMFAGLFGTHVGVKLDPAGLEELRALPGSGPFGPEERPMGGYLSLPQDLSDEEQTVWVDRARDHVAMLPPKVKKPKK